MDSSKKTAIIIGGGIGGPVVAMFLKRAGIDAQIYEAQPAPDDDQGYILSEAALRQGVSITWGKTLTDIDITSEQQVIARFADGTTAHGDFLIGSDGLHSRTRQIIAPNAPKPSYTGLISCGGYAHNTTL